MHIIGDHPNYTVKFIIHRILYNNEKGERDKPFLLVRRLIIIALTIRVFLFKIISKSLRTRTFAKLSDISVSFLPRKNGEFL